LMKFSMIPTSIRIESIFGLDPQGCQTIIQVSC
jgi:hypothetical protein